jgi:Cof subfamily protein (haloacid dehalogenase superfamily)
MKYKLLVIDVDGTLLNSKKEIGKRTLYTLRNVQQTGVRIVIASGRPTYGLLPLAKQLELDNYGGFILSYNGCQIIEAKTGAIVYEKRINPELIPYIEKKSRKNNFAIFTYKEDTIITDTPDNEHILSEARINRMKIVHEPEFSTAIDFSPCKCMLVSDNEEALTGLEKHWEKRLAGSLDVFRSEPYFLEVVPPQVDKAYTLSVLLRQLNIDKEEVVAIGDSVCDVTMIQMAGLGVAMGNAQESVRRCADVTTETNDNEGVALAAEKLILNEIHPADIPLEQLNAQSEHTLMGNLGINYTFISDERVEATMPVDYRTRQPYGILHGGATLALAETVAGLGSMAVCQPDEVAVGMQVSGNHISSAHEGDTVRAVGTIVHKGRTSHVWNVDVFTSTGKLVSSIRVVNSIMKKR